MSTQTAGMSARQKVLVQVTSNPILSAQPNLPLPLSATHPDPEPLRLHNQHLDKQADSASLRRHSVRRLHPVGLASHRHWAVRVALSVSLLRQGRGVPSANRLAWELPRVLVRLPKLAQNPLLSPNPLNPPLASRASLPNPRRSLDRQRHNHLADSVHLHRQVQDRPGAPLAGPPLVSRLNQLQLHLHSASNHNKPHLRLSANPHNLLRRLRSHRLRNRLPPHSVSLQRRSKQAARSANQRSANPHNQRHHHHLVNRHNQQQHRHLRNNRRPQHPLCSANPRNQLPLPHSASLPSSYPPPSVKPRSPQHRPLSRRHLKQRDPLPSVLQAGRPHHSH